MCNLELQFKDLGGARRELVANISHPESYRIEAVIKDEEEDGDFVRIIKFRLSDGGSSVKTTNENLNLYEYQGTKKYAHVIVLYQNESGENKTIYRKSVKEVNDKIGGV